MDELVLTENYKNNLKKVIKNFKFLKTYCIITKVKQLNEIKLKIKTNKYRTTFYEKIWINWKYCTKT